MYLWFNKGQHTEYRNIFYTLISFLKWLTKQLTTVQCEKRKERELSFQRTNVC